MQASFFDSLKCIPKTKTLMLIYPAWTLGLVLLATLLSIGAAALTKHLGLSDQLQADDISGILQRSLISIAVLFPLELYFLPRWVLAMDAFKPGESGNSKENWKQLFEERWGKVFLARILVTTAYSIGFFLCLIPGFIILLYFGWTPWRVLLRGESISTAAKAVSKSMALLWPQVIVAVGTILLIIIVLSEVAAQAIAPLGGAHAWQISNLFNQFLIIWMNAALLALYQWMESTAVTAGNTSGNGS